MVQAVPEIAGVRQFEDVGLLPVLELEAAYAHRQMGQKFAEHILGLDSKRPAKILGQLSGFVTLVNAYAARPTSMKTEGLTLQVLY